MMDPNQIIDALGGDASLGETLGIVRSTVYAWRTTGIPPQRAMAIAKVAKDRAAFLQKVTLETIMRSQIKKPPGQSRSKALPEPATPAVSKPSSRSSKMSTDLNSG